MKAETNAANEHWLEVLSLYAEMSERMGLLLQSQD